jgi:CheY-like chemotaxis protein
MERINSRILIVDDDPSVRELLTEVMGYEGFTLATATDGQAALEAVKAQVPDLVLLDLQMPNMGGAC